MMSNIDKEDVNDSYLCDQRQEKLNKNVFKILRCLQASTI